eukprot:TRINITY_DN4592_c0_g1_i4.p1 TRINITY_DN4592_c0_g1~~TRINITY_DN4592_c0_g1_i4.p1  ORF type:complete len:976 (+),score=215.75 TRINITY_DN4592_c0_g1_i4:1181-4108(+)
MRSETCTKILLVNSLINLTSLKKMMKKRPSHKRRRNGSRCCRLRVCRFVVVIVILVVVADENRKMRHKVEENPEEFQLVSEIVRIVGHWFYETIHVVILNAFLKQRFHRESDLAQLLKLPQKQVGSALVKLMNHQILVKNICQSSPVPGAGRGVSRNFNLWMMNLDQFINAVQYRLLMMKHDLEKEIDRISSVILECDQCQNRYTKEDLVNLFNPLLKQYFCKYCKVQLKDISSTGDDEIEKLRASYNLIDPQIKPLVEKLKELPKKRNVKKDVNGPPMKANSTLRAQPSSGVNRTIPRKKPVTQKVNEPTVVSNVQSKIMEIDIDDKSYFSLRPLVIGLDEHTIFLPIMKDLDTYKKDVASRLAKEVLDEVAEFRMILGSLVYQYEITAHSLYLGHCRGFSGREIVRLLSLLSRNVVPLKLQEFIYKKTNDDEFYKATMTVRDKNRAVRSTDKQLLVKMLGEQSVRNLVSDANNLEEIESDKAKYWSFPIKEGTNEAFKSACGIPIIDEYDYLKSTTQDLDIRLKPTTQLRPYQRFAASRIFWNRFQCHSGVLVLPCGAGKTLVGISVLAAVKKATIIFCFSNLALNQWKEQIEKWTVLNRNEISRFSSQHQNEWNPNANIIITTYPMFSACEDKRKDTSKNMIEQCKQREWGLMILDEVHLAPATIFRKVTNKMRCHIKLGLTATMVREDDLIPQVPFLVGPKLFDLDIFIPRMYGHIAPVECTEIHVPLTEVFKRAFAAPTSNAQIKKLIWICNPNKIRVVHSLIQNHLKQGHKIMMFCDILFALSFYEMWLKRPKIEGNTPESDRQAILQNFRKKKGGDCVLFSTVGDQSIDLPEADVVIQLALTDRSRMQEGQRIGRVQRPEAGKERAYFYSLVSEGTSEVAFAQARRTFLEENGYTVTVKEGSDWESMADITELDTRTQTGLLKEITAEIHRREKDKDKGAAKPRAAQKRPRAVNKKTELNRINKRLKQ